MNSVEDQVLRALARNRVRGFHFAGHFLGIAFAAQEGPGCAATMDIGSHCCDPDGTLDPVALGVFVDLALAALVRTSVPPASRLATAQLHLRLSGRPVHAEVSSIGAFAGFLDPDRRRYGSADIQLTSVGEVVGQASAVFAVWPAPTSFAVGAPDLVAKACVLEGVDPSGMSSEERAVLDAARRAMSSRRPFWQTFWDMRTRHLGGCGWARVGVTPQLANRAGDVQGGVLIGQAVAAAQAAVGDGWRVVSLDIHFLSPVRQGCVIARACVLRTGKGIASVRVESWVRGGGKVCESLLSLRRETAMGVM